jgi:hypothetical protein
MQAAKRPSEGGNGRAGFVQRTSVHGGVAKQHCYCVCSDGLCDYVRMQRPETLAEMCRGLPPRRPDVYSVVRQIVHREGFFRLWSGLSATM